MLDHIIIWAIRVVEVMFFTGLIGCVATVLLSWISILRVAFTSKD